MKTEFARIKIGTEKLPLDKLEKQFITIFEAAINKGIPVWGFTNEESGQYMFGPMDCFKDVFGENFVIFKFDLENYIQTTKDVFWLADLKENPMQSRLMRYEGKAH